MFENRKILLDIVVLCAAGTILWIAPAWPPANSPVHFEAAEMAPSPPPQTKTAPPKVILITQQQRMLDGEVFTKELLLEMEAGKDGKISKREFLAFMGQEFDRLDTNNEGEIDVSELRKQQVPPTVGK